MDDLSEAFYSAAALLRIHAPLKVQVKSLAGFRAYAEYHQGQVIVKVSDAFLHVERNVVVGLGLDLLSRMFHKPVAGKAYVHAYREFMKSHAAHKLHKTLRLQRGRKRRLDPRGRRYNLNEIVAKLVSENTVLQTLSIPKIGWSQKEALGRVGVYDEETNEIVISKALDKKTVPFFAVEYVIFHELLHAKHPAKENTSRRTVHTKQFKEEEKKYFFFKEANRWLKENDLMRQEL